MATKSTEGRDAQVQGQADPHQLPDREVRRPARPARLSRPALRTAAALAGAALARRQRPAGLAAFVHQGRPDPRPGPRRRLHRLWPGRRRQLPVLGPPPGHAVGAAVPAGQPAHAVRAGAALRRMAGRRLRRLVVPRRAQGLAQARRLRRGAVALPRQGRRRAPAPAQGRLGRRRRVAAARRVLPPEPQVGGRHAGRDRSRSARSTSRPACTTAGTPCPKSPGRRARTTGCR